MRTPLCEEFGIDYPIFAFTPSEHVAAAVSRAAKELHEDLYTPIDAVIEEARSQQAAKVATLEAELEAARKALANLD